MLQRKPGALRNGAPFTRLPEGFKRLQRALPKRPGGDRKMVEVLALVRNPTAGMNCEPILTVCLRVSNVYSLSPSHAPRSLSGLFVRLRSLLPHGYSTERFGRKGRKVVR